MNRQANFRQTLFAILRKSKRATLLTSQRTVGSHLLLRQRSHYHPTFTDFKTIFLFLLLLLNLNFSIAQTNSHHVKVNGYYKSNGTYVQPYFRTASNSTNRDNFSTEGNANPYTGKAGWIEPDSKYNTFYYSTYTYNPSEIKSEYATNSTLSITYKNRTYIEDEHGNYTCYLTVKDERTFNIYDMNNELILYLVINHRGDWRIFNSDWIYIKTIFVESEK